MIISKIDGTICKNLTGLSIHLKKYSISLLDYYVQYEQFVIPKCIICNSDAMYRKGLVFHKTCCSTECKLVQSKIGIPHTDESKEKLRKCRIEYLNQKNGKTAWERRASGKMSYIEQWFFDKCKEYNLPEKYDIVNEYSIFKYSIDFAFLNEKVAVELDGKCHFINGEQRIKTDIEKDEYLIKNGWRVFRIRYDELLDSKMDELLLFIGDTIKVKNFDGQIYRNIKSNPIELNLVCSNSECKTLHNNPKYCSIKCFHSDNAGKVRLHTRKIERPSYDTLVNDVEKMGYLATGRKYGVSGNCIRKWVIPKKA
jgi:very-short-patch-repair endonuclease